MGIKAKHKGSFKKAERFYKRVIHHSYLPEFDEYGRLGVDALSKATPVDTGKTAESWTSATVQENERTKLVWSNTNVNNGVNIAVILQYGHGTGTGGYVEGRDYINPALEPIFQMIEDETWKKVTKT